MLRVALMSEYELLEKLTKSKMPVDERVQYELDLIKNGPPFIAKSFLKAFQDVIVDGNSPQNLNECHSIIAYNLGFTKSHPGKISFHYPVEPGALPDIDTDFAYPDQVKEYIRNKYGANRVIGIPTYGRYKFRALLTDLCRVVTDEDGERYVSIEDVKAFNKKLPFKLDQQVSSDMADEEDNEDDDELFSNPDIQQFQRRYPKIFEHFSRLYATPKYRGRHAAGVAILPDEARNTLPLSMLSGNVCAEWTEGQGVSELGSIGVIKLDILGLKTLKILDTTNHLIMQRYDIDEETPWPCACKKQGLKCPTNSKMPMLLRSGEKLIDFNKICMNVPKVYRSISEGATQGVFQFEPEGITKFTKKYGPKRFLDLALITSLYRPGPLDAKLDKLGMPIDPDDPSWKSAPSAAHAFIERYNGREKVYYASPKLEDVLGESYGVAVFQEDISRIIMKMTKCNFNDAEKVRKFLTKVKPEALKSDPDKIAELKKYEAKFTAQALENNCTPEEIRGVWNLIVPFARYGFNRSHAVAYSMISFQTAFCRTQFPVEFLTALMIHNVDKTDKLVEYVRTAQKLNLKILPPDLNTSDVSFKITENGEILAGFTVFKGIGDKAADEIINNRATQGPFKSVEDFLSRDIAWRRLDVGDLQVLVKGGTFDQFNENRAQVLTQILVQKKKVKKFEDLATFDLEQSVKEFDIFAEPGETKQQEIDISLIKPWSKAVVEHNFREAFGFLLEDYLTKNKEKVAQAHKVIHDIVKQSKKDATVGVIQEIKILVQKNGEKYARITATNMDGIKEQWLLFASVWNVFKNDIKFYYTYVCIGKKDDKGTFLVDSMKDMEDYLK
jgi:DNA polymerase-3 subunit alpha